MLPITLPRALFSSVPVSRDSEPSRTTPGPETESAKWNSALIHFVIHAGAFPAETRHNTPFKKYS